MRHSVSCPSLRQERWIQRDIAKGVEYFPQVGNNLWKSPGPRAGSSRSDRWQARLRPCPKAMPETRRRRFIDGRHLGCGGSRPSSRKDGRRGPGSRVCPRKRHIASSSPPCTPRGVRRRAAAGGSARAVSSGARELLPFAGVELARWDRHRASFLTGQCPTHAGLSSRRRHGLTTRGVRADRVGVAFSLADAARQP